MAHDDPTSISAVQTMLEIERIRALKARYLRFLDTKQWTEYRGTLAEDAQARYDAGGGSPSLVLGNSADEIARNISHALEGAVSVHHAHGAEIELTSATTANGIWAMNDVVHRGGPEEPASMGWGHYADRYVKGRDGEWRIGAFTVRRLLVSRVPFLNHPDLAPS